MNGHEFEAALLDLFTMLGYSVQNTGGYRDKGVDRIATSNGVRTAVQAKRQSSPVRLAGVRAVIDGRKRQGCDRGIVVTNNFFWPQAEQCAAAWGIDLWDRFTLATFLEGPEPLIDRTSCGVCGEQITAGIGAYCFKHRARFQGNLLCMACQKKQYRRAA